MHLELKPRVRLATRRRRARVVGAVIACLVAVGGVFGASFLSYHERFVINDINVVGTQALSAAAVESAFGSQVNDGVRHFFARSNIFFYPYSELQQKLLEQFPLMQAVSFSRASMLSQAITISVHEREPKYLWCSSTCYFMDAQGFIFAPATNPGGFLIFRGGLVNGEDPLGQTFMRGRLEKLATIVEELKSSGFPAEGASVENEQDISIPLSSGYYVKTTITAMPDELSKNLNLAISSDRLVGKLEQLEYVDLRFGNRVYYKLHGEEL